MNELLLNAFIILFVSVDPLGVAPIYAALTQNDAPHRRRRTAWKGVALAALVLYGFAFAGTPLLAYLGVSMPAFRIAGGILLFILALDMVFARESGFRSATGDEIAEADLKRDVSVFPLAVPLIAGPGAMTSILLLMDRAGGDPATVALVLAVLAVVLALTLLAFLFIAQLMHLLGVTGINVVTRVLGILLAALAVQFVLDGLSRGLLLT